MAITDGLQNLEERNSDGSGNNLLDPELGTADSPFSRLADPVYADGIGAVEPDENARTISNAIADEEKVVESSFGASDLFTFFGQFIDHDIDLAKGAKTEQLSIEIPADDPVFDPANPLTLDRSAFADGTGVTGTPREQVNEITSFADASNIYGSSEELTQLLRADGGDSAYLLTSDEGYAPTLGQLRQAYPNLDADHPDLVAGPPTNDAYVGGDVRINENVALTSMHSAWIVDHNNQVDRLRGEHPDWTEDQLFSGARVIVEALYQNVVFNEYLPFLLGSENIPEYSGYDSTIDPSIATEFATAAYRLGHSQLSSVLHRTNEDGSEATDGNLGLFDAFFSPSELTNGGGVDGLVRGLAGNSGQQIDENIVDDVRNLLFANIGTGSDLAALNIVRGRDHGIPTLNDMRVALGLTPFADFSELTSDPILAAQFAEVYASIDDVELWIGGLAEEKVPGSQLGSTFHAIVLDQFLRLRDGDRLYFEERLKDFPELLAEIKDTSFSDILLRTTGIDYLQDDVFVAHNRIGGTREDDYLRGTNDHDLIIGFDGDDQIIGRRGDDDLYGGDGDDYILGNEGDDVIDGEAGDDALVGGAGNDEISGGDGIDWLDGGQGDDVLDGGAGDDSLVGGAGNDEISGGDDNDWLDGGRGNDVLNGEAGDDALAGGAGNDEISGGDGIDWLNGGRGDDLLVGGKDDDVLQGESGNDRLYGDSKGTLDGNAVSDSDSLEGGAGNDILVGDAAELSGNAVAASDYLEGGRGNDILYGDAVKMTGNATGADDNLQGGRGNDTLYGDSETAEAGTTGGDDYLVGGRGNDTLVGGGGEDSLVGGRGNDVFVFASGSGEDVIWDFSQVGRNDDTIDVTAFGFNDVSDINIFDLFGDAVVEFGGSDRVTLVGVDAATLTDEDFLIA